VVNWLSTGFRTERDGETVEVGGQRLKVNAGWFRGGQARYRPNKAGLLSPEAIKESILDGWLPPQPFIDKGSPILAFGSCFASNIAKHLSGAGFNLVGAEQRDVYLMVCNEGIVNTFTIRQMVEWVFDGKLPHVPVWREGHGLHAFDEPERVKTKALFDQAQVLIITLGLSEVWYDKTTGDVFSATIPRADFDETKHGFRVSTVSENVANLAAVYRRLRVALPNTHVIFTLSPIPLIATFRPVSCISANSASKAILRAAVDELVRGQTDDRLHYWPSYEIVMEGFRDAFKPDNRHVKDAVLGFIMALFEQSYCMAGPSDEDVLRRYFDAAVASGEVPRKMALPGVMAQAARDLKPGKAELARLLLRRAALDNP
jgi:hypothetical protein